MRFPTYPPSQKRRTDPKNPPRPTIKYLVIVARDVPSVRLAR
jgi:hypothetical protein